MAEAGYKPVPHDAAFREALLAKPSVKEARAALCDEMLEITDNGTCNNIWNALADTPEQAANLRARAELMQQIAAIVKENNWTQAEAASHCGVTQPRINDLLRGRVSRFSLDALLNVATALGRRVHFELEPA